MDLPTVVTLFVSPDGATRVSRMTAHGEELLQPEPEIAAVCAGIYRRLAGGAHTTTTDNSRLVAALREVAGSIDQARIAVSEPLAQAAEIVTDLRALIQRLDQIETYLHEHLVTAKTVKEWIDEVYLKNPIIVSKIRGQ